MDDAFKTMMKEFPSYAKQYELEQKEKNRKENEKRMKHFDEKYPHLNSKNLIPQKGNVLIEDGCIYFMDKNTYIIYKHHSSKQEWNICNNPSSVILKLFDYHSSPTFFWFYSMFSWKYLFTVFSCYTFYNCIKKIGN
jgi:hypothetical protein